MPEEILSPRVIVTRRYAGHSMEMTRQAMNTPGRDERPRVKYGLHLYRALPMGIHLVPTGDLEPNLPSSNLDAGLEHLDLLLSPRRDERPPGVMGQPEA